VLTSISALAVTGGVEGLPVDNGRITVIALLGLGAVVLFYYANQNDGGPTAPIPSIQTEAQVEALGVQSQYQSSLSIGSADMSTNYHPQVHFWVPGWDPAPSATKTITTPHRYPAIPGGNMSTVMHKGWAAFTKCAPADNDWRLNPPEAAVI
jgi:hypothetical protein